MTDEKTMYGYTLTLTVKDQGVTSFSATRDLETQWKMAEFLAWDIARMLSPMNVPPEPDAIVLALREGSSHRNPLEVVAWLMSKWDGDVGIEEVFSSVVIDLDKLTSGEDEKETEMIVSLTKDVIEAQGWKWKRSIKEEGLV